MKYILGIGLLFKYFRGTTTIKIFSDDTFIDELTLDESITSERRDRMYMTDHLDTISSTSLLQNLDLSRKLNVEANYKDEMPKKMFWYEIDESVLGRKISFEFEDKNSNYTNGFMTKSNLVSLPSILLFPKFEFDNKKIKKFWRFIHRRFVRRYTFRDNRLMANEYGTADVHPYWPIAVKLYNDKDQLQERDQWFGGKQKIHVMLRKKFGVHHIYHKNTDRPKIPLVLGDTSTFITYNHYYNLLNRINEDQRSNNTKD